MLVLPTAPSSGLSPRADAPLDDSTNGSRAWRLPGARVHCLIPRLRLSSLHRPEGVSQPSFYNWTQRLANTAREKSRKRRQRALSPNRSVGFQSVQVTPPEGAASVKIQLPGGALIELSNDMSIIEQVVGQLLQQQGTAGADAC